MTGIKVKKQLAMVIDLNKCMGCQTCSIACKRLWTREDGMEYMWWNKVNTVPGLGSPKGWEKMGGGFKDGVPQPGKLPEMKDFGEFWDFDYEGVLSKGKAQRDYLVPKRSSDWGVNWEEDEAKGEWPNCFYFYLPRICNHCSQPACLSACPRSAIYKRVEDGIVLIDEERCKGYRYCMEACPYKVLYFNYKRKIAQKCILCFPRIEKRIAPACARQCPGRARFIGFLEDKKSQVYKLTKEWRVALPLHPEFETEPNVFYIPPLSPFKLDEDGRITDEKRIPMDYLKELFGEGVERALGILEDERERKKKGKRSKLMDTLIGYRWPGDFFHGFTEAPV